MTRRIAWAWLYLLAGCASLFVVGCYAWTWYVAWPMALTLTLILTVFLATGYSINIVANPDKPKDSK